jgi:cytochrome c5
MKPQALLVAFAAFIVAPRAIADTGEEIYGNRCGLCHAGGAGGAPKFRNREDWEPRAARGKLALYDVALHGKPNTAMMARGGFRDLSDHEVMSAVDYMVAQAGLNPGLRPEPAPPAAPQAAVAAAEFDDRTATTRVADALLAPPGSSIEFQDDAASIGGLGVRVATREGVVWLRGTVKTAEIVERAEAIARSESGGRKVENRLVPASVHE